MIVGCKNNQKKHSLNNKKNKQINIEFNPNIHTSHIIELFVWPGEYPTRPMVDEAQKYFEPYKNHPAIKLSDSLFQNEIFYFDELTEILLYLEPFPSTKFQYSLKNSPYAEKTEIINEWMQKLSTFYVDAKVEFFLKENEQFYNGVKIEVENNLPPSGFIKLMEDYYRENKVSYTIIPAPEMPTGGEYGQRGIGPYVYTENGTLIYQVISASIPIKKDSVTKQYEGFGFDNKEFILRNSYHEFGHAFINPLLEKEKNKRIVESYQQLFTLTLQQVMLKQNYDNWLDCITEHLVRLGEIRLAERNGNKEWAEELRKYHIVELKFIFLPELEEQIKKYETDPSYKSFEDYLPELLSVLDKFDFSEIEGRLK